MERLDGVRKLLIKELKERTANKVEAQNTSKIIQDDEIINTYVAKYIDEMTNEIIELNKERYKQELEKVKKDEEMRQYIKKTRVLLYEGFFMAFIVGLAVNQITDLIGLYKGTVSYNERITNYTVISCLILIFASVGIYFWNFIVNFMKYIKEKE